MMAFIENCRRGRGGEHTGIVIHSLISPVSACRLFSHCASVICCIIIYFFYPAPTKTAPVTVCACLSLHTGSNTKPQPSLKMQIGSICGLLLSESGWAYWGKFLCAAVWVYVWLCASVLHKVSLPWLFASVSLVTVCLHFFFFFWCNVQYWQDERHLSFCVCDWCMCEMLLFTRVQILPVTGLQ